MDITNTEYSNDFTQSLPVQPCGPEAKQAITKNNKKNPSAH